MKKLFLSLAFIGLGTFAMAQQAQSSKMQMKHGEMKQSMEMRHQKHLDKMKADLNLNEDQVMKIKAMQQERAHNRQNEMAERKNAKMNKRANEKQEMKKILSPDQYSRWENHMNSKMAKMKNKKMMMRNHPSKMQHK